MLVTHGNDLSMLGEQFHNLQMRCVNMCLAWLLIAKDHILNHSGRSGWAGLPYGPKTESNQVHAIKSAIAVRGPSAGGSLRWQYL